MNTLRRSIAFAAIALGMKGRVVFNAAKADDGPTEILLTGPVGGSWWSDEGIKAKEVTDAIDAVPPGKKIILGINSPGGACDEGLAIYNAIKRRSADITARIDGYACSIASVFPLAAGRVVSPKSCVWMIHDPWMATVGNSDDHRKTINALEAHAKVLSSIYEEHTGRDREECRAAMKAETWMTGEEAAEWGLATETNDDAVTLDEIKDSPYARVPSLLIHATQLGLPIRHLQPFAMFRRPTPAPISNSNTQQPMNRTAILAALKKHGGKMEDNANDEQLLAEVGKLVASGKITFAEMAAFQAQPAPVPAPAAAATPTPVPAPAPAPTAPAPDPAIVNRLAALEAENTRLRRNDVAASVDQAIRERRIPAAARESWINRGLREDGAMAELATYPANLPGTAPVVEITSSDPKDIFAGITALKRPMAAVCRGEDVLPKDIRENSIAISNAVRAGGQKLIEVFNASTVTISSDLKLTVLLANQGISAFKRRMLPVTIWSYLFQNTPLQGTDKIAVPFWPRFSTASQDFVQANGYVTPANRSVEDREVTVNKRKYQMFEFNSAEMNRQPFFTLTKFTEQSLEQLGIDVWSDILSGVTIANYATAVVTELPDGFNTDDVIDIASACDTAEWPDVGRAMVLDIPYKTSLLKDPDLKNVDKSGSDAALRNGSLGSIAGFSEIYASNKIPTNSEKLRGFTTLRQAMLVATSPVMPAPGVRKQLVNYQVITDPETGLSIEYRYWGTPQKDEDTEVVECNYGYGKGDGDALLRITNP